MVSRPELRRRPGSWQTLVHGKHDILENDPATKKKHMPNLCQENIDLHPTPPYILGPGALRGWGASQHFLEYRGGVGILVYRGGWRYYSLSWGIRVGGGVN